jgi:hypothetical protein
MLDPATVQILFADLQPPIVARSKANPPQSLSCAAAVLAQCARLLGLPVTQYDWRPYGPRLKKAPLAKGAKLAQIWPEAATPALPLTRDVPAK